MTAANFMLYPDHAVLTMDTLGMNSETRRPFFFTTKFYPLPLYYGVMFATGIGDFATLWFASLEKILARDIVHLNEYVTAGLQSISPGFGFTENNTTTIYHLGYSVLEERYVGFAYRSTTGFQSERLQYGNFTKPGIHNVHFESFPADFIAIMEEQRRIDNLRPEEDRVYIGGEIQAVALQNKTTFIQTIHRFDDYDLLYEQMCDDLPANQNT